MKHGLAWLETTLDGTTAVCHCGWRSGQHRQSLNALSELVGHEDLEDS